LEKEKGNLHMLRDNLKVYTYMYTYTYILQSRVEGVLLYSQNCERTLHTT
jgi:hypothetical protein